VRGRFPVAQPVAAQPDQPSVELVVQAGRPLRVALDERIQLKQVRQAVTGTVTQPVYAYDRIVIAAGTKVRGRVTQIGGGSKFIRARAYLNGNFSGGIAYYPASVDAIGTAALEIARQIRNQYTIAYAALNQVLDGTYRDSRRRVGPRNVCRSGPAPDIARPSFRLRHDLRSGDRCGFMRCSWSPR
jgi:hypothetical protein